MTTELTTIVLSRIEAIKLNGSLSTAPAADSYLIKFLENNQDLKTIQVLKEYVRIFKAEQLKYFKNN